MTALDTQWLRTLLVSDICDLMTEVKAGLYDDFEGNICGLSHH